MPEGGAVLLRGKDAGIVTLWDAAGTRHVVAGVFRTRRVTASGFRAGRWPAVFA